MDFWSRLIAGTSLSPASSSKAAANNPEKRLARFKKEYSHLLNVWRSYSDLSRDHEAAETIRSILQELTTTLGDESRRPLPHPCIAFAASKQIYIPIGKIAATSYKEGIIREGVGLFATLIDSEEEDFVENDGFSTSLMTLLVKITGVNSIRLGRETEVEIVELSFNITTKIRLDPEILPVWFTTREREDEEEDEEVDAHEKFTGKTHKEDFPLFYLLIDYIHDEGRIGDFARTGLLYIIEAASHSNALEQWIVESDLATMMATGLGALYSQLSRKLVIDHRPDELPPILALSDYEHPITTSEIVSSVDEGFGMNMETFLAHLVFWQDVLNHCKSSDVKQTLLEHFQVIFLQQLLYPSLLESSDIDGGSSVAVLTYLRRILEALDHPDMIHLILHYLLALPDSSKPTADSPTQVSAARKRKSMDLATIIASQQLEASTPALFNLVDLIQDCLKSENQQTVSVTLQLVSAVLRRHHRYAVPTLLSTSHVVAETPQRTMGGHEVEMNFLLGLAGVIGTEDDFDIIYDNHVKDCMSILESHPCSIDLVAPKTLGSTKTPGAQATIAGAPRDVRAHTLRPEDPMLKTLLVILGTFFMNSVETNLSLTGTIVDLATCGHMRLDGWLLPDGAGYTFDEEAEQSDDEEETTTREIDEMNLLEKRQLRNLRNNRRLPTWTDDTTPAILNTLQQLVSQIAAYREEVPRFDDLLQQRREAFQATSAIEVLPTSTIHQPPPRSSFDSEARSISPRRPTNVVDSLAQRILDKIDTPTRSRQGSPRGRRSADGQRGSGVGTPNMVPRSDGGVMRGSLSPLRQVGEDRIVDSQMRMLESVDRGILARRVGIPKIKRSGEEVEVIPFRLKGSMLAQNVGNDREDDEAEEEDEGKERKKAVDEAEEEAEKLVSVSHVLTNVLVLQEFLLELAALIQVRAGLFGEIKFV